MRGDPIRHGAALLRGGLALRAHPGSPSTGFAGADPVVHREWLRTDIETPRIVPDDLARFLAL